MSAPVRRLCRHPRAVACQAAWSVVAGWRYPPPDIELPMHGAAFFEAANEEVSAATATVYGISGAVNLGVGTVHIAAKSLAPTNQPAAASS
jgi:hypothetical protein